MIVIGILMIVGGIFLLAVMWGILMAQGWTGCWYERRTMRQMHANYNKHHRG